MLLAFQLADAQDSIAISSNAQLDLPLDLIELLGEMDDNESMFEIALSELKSTPNKPQQNRESAQIKKQNSPIAAPVGGDKK